jgi:RNA polymerase sigma factor (sigma-70 family)
MADGQAAFEAQRDSLLRLGQICLGAYSAEAEDMVHDTYLVALPRLSRELAPGLAEAWFRQICLRLCYARLRDRGGVLRCLEQEMTSYRLAMAVERVPTENLAVQKQQDLGLLRELIKRLQPDARQMIQLRNVHGMAYAQIAACLDIPLADVAERLVQARRKLRDLLDEAPRRGPTAPFPMAA